MSKLAFVILLGVAACAASEVTQGPNEEQGWRLVSGKTPTRAEYAAVVAACQDGSLPRPAGKPLESCLADLGMRRAP